MHQIEISIEAQTEMLQIADYIADILKNKPAADKQLGDFAQAIQDLQDFAAIYPVRYELDNRQLRQINVNHYLLIFELKKQTNVVTVLHAFHQTQDIQTHL